MAREAGSRGKRGRVIRCGRDGEGSFGAETMIAGHSLRRLLGGVGQGGAEGLVTEGGDCDQEDVGAGGGENPAGMFICDYDSLIFRIPK